MRRYREPLEREVANGSQNREKFQKYTIGDLFAIRRLRSARCAIEFFRGNNFKDR